MPSKTQSPLFRAAREWALSPFFWCVAIRIAFMALVPRSWQGDAVDYEQIATNLAAGHGFSRCFGDPYHLTAQRPPLYPLILGLFYMFASDHGVTAILLNLAFDLASMHLIRLWAKDLRISWTQKTPWLIALCPLLITYGMYPTTENMSITLFFAALVLTQRRKPALAGLLWGLLTLGRSYFLLFPFVLAGALFFKVLGGGRPWKPASIAILLATSFAAPTAWMARNYRELNRVTFTQTSMVGWQSYQGLCIANFDWWRPEHLSHMYSLPVLRKVIGSHCSPEEDIAKLDKELKQVVFDCVRDRPFEAARNVLIKGIMLFINWGLLFPYNRIPFMVQQLINAMLCFYWFCALKTLAGGRSKLAASTGLREAAWISALGLGYVVLVTLPFAVDARYLLGPFLTLLVVVLDLAKSPSKLIQSGLEVRRR